MNTTAAQLQCKGGKTQMKRSLAILTTLVLAISLLLSGTAMAEEKETLVMLMWGTTSSQEQLRDLIFANNPELAAKMDIEFVIAGSSDMDTAEKFRLSLLSGDYVADIVMLNSIEVTEFADQNCFVDCSDIIEPNKDQLLPSALECCYYGDNCVGISQSLKVGLWYYNKTMFDEVGINPNEIENVDQLIEAGLKLQEEYPESNMLHWGKTSCPDLILDAWANSDARIFDEDGNYVFNTDPAIRAVLEDVKKMKDAGIVGPISSWTPEWYAGHASRQIASTMCQSWFSTFGESLVSDGTTDEWAVALQPKLGLATERTGLTQAGAQMLLIPTTAKNVELAKEYMSFWLTYAGGYEITSKLGSAPIRYDVFEQFIDQPHPTWGESYYTVAKYAGETAGRPGFHGPKSTLEMQIIKPYVVQYLNDELDLDTMLDTCNNDLEMQLTNGLY